MKVIVYRENGSIYFDEFRNDNDAINYVLEKSGRLEEVDNMINGLTLDCASRLVLAEEFDSRWNEYMMKMIEVLAENGFEIVWDH
jgi:hypothetical protein